MSKLSPPARAASITVSTSSDGGTTWSKNVTSATIPGDDREWIAADQATKVCVSYHDIATDARVQQALQDGYGPAPAGVALVDLWVGGLAESGSGSTFIGPTFKAIIADQFRPRRPSWRRCWTPRRTR